MSIEIWKDIKGYEGYYMISNMGLIKSMPRYANNNYKGSLRFIKSKTLKAFTDKNGYQRVSLNKENVRQVICIHRLVAEAFIENDFNKPCINHKDGNPSNNNICNLEWCTYSENIFHSYNKLGRKGAWTNKKGFNNHTSKPIVCLNTNKVYGSGRQAAMELKLHQQHISKVCSGKLSTTGGLKFKYLNEG